MSLNSRFPVVFITATALTFAMFGPGISQAHATTVTESGGTDCSVDVDDATDVVVTKVGSDCVVQFKRVGTTNWTVPQGVTSIRYLIVAGGGGGAAVGAGGAGGLLAGTGKTVTPGATEALIVGAGGAGVGYTTTAAGKGGNSSGFGLTAFGGGGGFTLNPKTAGSDGGSGGSGSDGEGTQNLIWGGLGTVGQGNDAGAGYDYGPYLAGGGGGAGGPGGNAGYNLAGAGGNGKPDTITGTSVLYAGGGGGSWYQNSTTPSITRGLAQANSGGGDGGSWNGTTVTPAGNGTNNKGGGGGGGFGSGSNLGGNGGSGVVIISFTAVPKTAQSTLSITSTSGIFPTTTLETTGGDGTGTISYTVANGTASGCSVSSGVLTSTTAGTCLVTATKAGDITYSPISSAETTVTIAKASRTISFATTSYTIAYGTTQTVLATPSASDGAVSYSSGSSTACTVNSSTGVVSVTQASGTCEITATVAEGTGYLAASTSVPVTITAAAKAATITASGASVNFGTTYVTNANATGLNNPDAVSGATFSYVGTGSTSYGPSATMPVNAGTYSVTPSNAVFSTGSADNYTITYASGFIEIRKVSRTLSFGGTTSGTIAYGNTLNVTATPSVGDGAVSYFAGSSTGCSVNASTGEVTAISSTGTCTISATISEGTNHLTASTTTPFNVTLDNRPITIKVTDAETQFGDEVNSTTEVLTGSLASSDVISGVTFTYVGLGTTVYTSSTTKPTLEGTYTVTPSVAVLSMGNISNYSVTYATGTLTIVKSGIAIRTTDQSVALGETVSPDFTITAGSLLSGDVISSVTYTYTGFGGTTYSSSTEKPYAAGTYTVTPRLAVFSTGDAANYLITYVAGTLTISAPNPATNAQPADPLVSNTAPAIKTAKKTSKAIQFSAGSRALTKAHKSALKKSIKKSGLEATYVVTGTAGMLPGVTKKQVKRLAKLRANAIKTYLVKRGVDKSNISIKIKITNQRTVPKTKILAKIPVS